MDQQNGLFFTIWYGVYHKPTRQLNYSGGGHPPALLLHGPTAAESRLEILEASGPMIGAVPDLPYSPASITVDKNARLYLYSDGVYEIERTDTTMWPFSEFIEFMKQPGQDAAGASKMDRLIAYDRQIQGREEFVDDCSIVEFQFE
jgi:phosphoserine phosphatase RsbU/P